MCSKHDYANKDVISYIKSVIFINTKKSFDCLVYYAKSAIQTSSITETIKTVHYLKVRSHW